MRSPNHPQRRAGNVLLLGGLMLFVIFGMAALVIDLGLVRMTQRQMQAATDAAAREGLRYRDDIPAWLLDPNSTSDLVKQMQSDLGSGDPTDANYRDQVRRWLAREQVSLVYTDGVDSGTGNAVQFGAGPLFQVSGGVGDGNALQLIAIPGVDPATGGAVPIGVTVYKPNLQLNTGNAKEGDLVSGVFQPDVSNTPGIESADYTRTDFVPQTTGTDSFLVRLRRTQDTQGRDRAGNTVDNQTGISTTGPALPLLFGQASLIAGGADPVTGYSPRQDGISVRGTSIAQARPALAVGPATIADTMTGDPGMSGAATFSIDLTTWKSATTFTAANVSFFVAPRSSGMVMVGDILTATLPQALPPKAANQVYVPLIDSASGLVAGFGYVTTDGANLTKVVPRLAAENATTSMAVYVPSGTVSSVPDPNQQDVSGVLTFLLSDTNLAANGGVFLFAPALVR